ncbi:hypothetical protein H112_05036 [Trichophyton rubrum D6]|uniref:Transposase IS30-like HTH domain-containing protein n=3 Tax=Trichophyton rubrum TaxID=5551 RepID=A0A178EPI1_TRIRU|nr:uncharacterized protein TERG_02801 [Trichophyton rubrum CBS 118892]EZF22046.1 hypothetical protein H100_05059 [Trichophyton rubrum MR850]EZF41033.1 hypothetical protein H102_05045 [Trichophyton rubrum CBS 100081]EZF51539.1 hypothetical protein H103_05047 [Trichophyton rubrum CBS 288.86]EZF62284.1 hypothetical protein H104_05040 [Trichophyton rubrum CBS 289.86]EZF83659.1 hypothetical protein H110_05046 [Trichophyton rubrum MR1448]EZF94147.1 hypothetical protein H113_05086 [Trichophyton rubr
MARHLSKESRADILRLRAQGLTYKEIAERKGITHRQVQWTCESGDPTPKRRTGRPSQLSRAQVNRLVEYVCASPENRQLSYLELATVLQLGVGQFAVRNALYNAGFRRRVAREGRRELHRIDSDGGGGGGDAATAATTTTTTTDIQTTSTTTTTADIQTTAETQSRDERE